MNNLRNNIKDILNNNPFTNIYFVLKKDSKYSVKLADVESEGQKELSQMFISSLKSKVVDNGDLEIRNLSTYDNRENTLYLYDYEELPEELEILSNFKPDKIVEEEKFNFKKDTLRDLCGFLIYFGTMSTGIMLYKKHYSMLTFSRDTFLLGKVGARERFERLPKEEIIRLNGDFDVFKYDNNIFVLNVSVLQSKMGFTKIIISEADKKIEKIAQLKIANDTELIKSYTSDISFARKVSRINEELVLSNKKVERSKIIEFSKKAPGVKGRLTYSDDDKEIIIDSKKSAELLLKILNDSYLHSTLTEHDYDALTKDRVSLEETNHIN